jgi:hypothetical protein
MTRSFAPSLLLLTALAACASSDELKREPAVEVAERDERMRQADEKRRNFKAVLIRLDQAIDSYVQALANQGEFRADQQAERLYKLVHETVMDIGPALQRRDLPMAEPGTTFRELQKYASDNSQPDTQGIALAALGFSNQPEVMPLLVNGAQLSDPYVVDHAVLGLAVLRVPQTPPGVLASIVTRADHPLEGRVQAAWALYRIQTANQDQAPFVAIWRRLLMEQRDTLPAGVVFTAVRGLGSARDPANADLAASFLKHPTPGLRQAAALALGRMNAQSHWQQLLELLGPQETVQNVRLHARKALSELAGGVDHKYDVAAWRRIFDRGPR